MAVVVSVVRSSGHHWRTSRTPPRNGHGPTRVGRIQIAALTLFGGRPSAGKSTAARWFAARLSRGELEGCWKGKPQKVAYIAAEETAKYVLKPALRAAGADMSGSSPPR